MYITDKIFEKFWTLNKTIVYSTRSYLFENRIGTKLNSNMAP